MMLSPHPMDHAQKRALQGTNGITGLGLRHIRLPSYTPACFWPDAPRPSSRNPAQNLIRTNLVDGFERLAIAWLHGDAEERSAAARPQRTPTRTVLLLESI